MPTLTRCVAKLVGIVGVLLSTAVLSASAHAAALGGGFALVKGGYEAVRLMVDAYSAIHGNLCHNWWAVEYADGLVCYNSFKAKRNFWDVFRYFTGNSEGDCDSFFIKGGRQHSACYEMFGAWEMVQKHGQIVRIWRKMPVIPTTPGASPREPDAGHVGK